METAVLMEIVKSLCETSRGCCTEASSRWSGSGKPQQAGGRYCDQDEGGLIPVDVKLAATPRPAMASGIQIFQNDLKGKAKAGYVIHPGDITLPLGSGVTALPFAEL